MELRYRQTLIDGTLQNGVLVKTENGRIVSVSRSDKPAQKGILIPAYLDTHIHGILGADTMDGASAVEKMAAALPRFGVGAFLPTTMNASVSDTRAALTGINAAMQKGPEGAKILGAHLEGPFLASAHLGAQGGEFCLAPSVDSYLSIAKGLEHAVRMVSLSPELEGAQSLTRFLTQKGVVVSAAHTGASLAQMEQAQRFGVTQVTHLFNGMNSLHHRLPGVPGSALTMDALRCQLIADGVHLHPAILKLCFRAKGVGGICLITDAMAACGMPDGLYHLGPEDVVVKEGVARIAAGNLAGSTLTLDAAVRTMVRFAGASAAEAIRMACETPADALGLHDLGRIRPGAQANLAVLSEDLFVQKTYVAGKLVYNGDAQ